MKREYERQNTEFCNQNEKYMYSVENKRIKKEKESRPTLRVRRRFRIAAGEELRDYVGR